MEIVSLKSFYLSIENENPGNFNCDRVEIQTIGKTRSYISVGIIPSSD